MVSGGSGCEVAEHWNQSILSIQQGKPEFGYRSTRQRNAGRVDGADLHIGEGTLPVRVQVIRAGAVEAGVDQDGEVF